MSDSAPPPPPLPPDEWSARIPSREGAPDHEFPPRPEVVRVERPAGQAADRPAEHEGYAPPDLPSHPTPALQRPEQARPPLWRRPPGQKDDLGEPTGSG